MDWEGHSPEVLQAMRDHLEALKGLGIEAIKRLTYAQRQNRAFTPSAGDVRVG